MGDSRKPEEIVSSWGIDPEKVGKEDLGFSNIKDPYNEFYSVEGVSEEHHIAASTVAAFLKYSEEIDDNPSKGQTKEVEKAIRSIDRFMERGVFDSSPEFLYDSQYEEDLQRILQDRNMNKEITLSQLEDGEDPTVREDFSYIESKLIETLLGRPYTK